MQLGQLLDRANALKFSGNKGYMWLSMLEYKFGTERVKLCCILGVTEMSSLKVRQIPYKNLEFVHKTSL